MAHKILIVDDEEDLRFLLRERLVAEGYAVFQAGDGLEGLEAAKQNKPDLVIFDLMMPVMSGEQFWHNLKKNPELKNIPTIILTARRQSQDRYWGHTMPARDFCTKPYRLDELVRRVKEKLAEKSGLKLVGDEAGKR